MTNIFNKLSHLIYIIPHEGEIRVLFILYIKIRFTFPKGGYRAAIQTEFPMERRVKYIYETIAFELGDS